MNFFDWLNPEKAGKEIGRTISQEQENQRKSQIQTEEDATKKYTADYLSQLEGPYGKAYDANRLNLVNTVGAFNKERSSDYGMELGRAGLGNTVAGSLLKNKLSTQHSRTLGQTLSGLDASRLQQMAGLKFTAMQMAANKVANRVAENAALAAQKQEEAMAIPNTIIKYLGEQTQQAKQALGGYLTGGMSGAGSTGVSYGLYDNTGAMNRGYSYDSNGNLTYTGGV